MSDHCNYCGLHHHESHKCAPSRIAILEREIAILRRQRDELRQACKKARDLYWVAYRATTGEPLDNADYLLVKRAKVEAGKLLDALAADQ